MKKIYFFLLCGLMFATTTNAKQTWQIGYPNASDVIATLSGDIATTSSKGFVLNSVTRTPVVEGVAICLEPGSEINLIYTAYVTPLQGTHVGDIRYTWRVNGVPVGGNFPILGLIAPVEIDNGGIVTLTVTLDGSPTYTTQWGDTVKLLDPNDLEIIPTGTIFCGIANEMTFTLENAIPGEITWWYNGLLVGFQPSLQLFLNPGQTHSVTVRIIQIQGVETCAAEKDMIVTVPGHIPLQIGVKTTTGDTITERPEILLAEAGLQLDLNMITDNRDDLTLQWRILSPETLPEYSLTGPTNQESTTTAIFDDNFRTQRFIQEIEAFVTDADGCETRDTIWIQVFFAETANVGIENFRPLQVYPNPVTNELRLTIDELQIGEIIELFDMTGRRVFSSRINCHSSVVNRHFTIDMSPFQQGNYILRIGNRVAKVVKQ